MADKKVKTAIEGLPVLWRTVWTSLSKKCVVNIDRYNDLSIHGQKPKNDFKIKNFWRMSTGAADKKGWDWWGDTDVSVTEIKGPKTFEEACEAVIICDDMSMSSDNAAGDATFTSWKQFWDSALRDLENDLPNWPGAPLRAVWIRGFDGNFSSILAQKDDKTYYLVTLGTS